MKTVELSVQEQSEFCVCSVLQAIFKTDGRILSQEEIARNLTRGKNKKGKNDGYLINDERIKKFMKSIGFNYASFGVHETPFNEPDELLKEMCQHYGIIGIGTHAYLLRSFNDPMIKMTDPKNGQEVEKDYFELLREMGDDGVFGLVKKI